jgi:hypothetical protein
VLRPARALLTIPLLALAAPGAHGQGSAPAAAGPAGAPTEPLGRYLADLERTRRLPPETASLERLRDVLTGAEERLARGDVRAAASGLFAIVESPRYLPWKDTPPYQHCELLLGRALQRGGAGMSAEGYLLRVLQRGPASSYFVPAHRAMVDLALDSRQYARVLGVLEGLRFAGTLPGDSAAERDYLRGRIAYQAGDLPGASEALGRVPRLSRLYASAAYFRGLIAARRSNWKDARGAFCEILPDKRGGTLAFNIDGRYFQLQDLARMALGRIAHEQDRYDEAYYFYFSVPEDSDRLAEALHEAAWSMYQKGEIRAARAFVEAFDASFPDSPLRPEVSLLRANLALRACSFDVARTEAAALVATYAPLQRRVAEAAGNPARAGALTARLLARPAALGATVDDDGRLLTLLKLDDRFRDLRALIEETAADQREAGEALARWTRLDQAVAGGAEVNIQRAASSPEAAQLLEDVEALVAEAAGEPELAPRAEALLMEASLYAYPPRPSSPYAAEADEARALMASLGALHADTVAAAQRLAMEAFRELDERLRGLFRQTRLVHIDAVVGRKKRLEVEIANLRAGRYTADIYAKLKSEGTLGDDEEYWPFEGEYWADEYENFR